LHLLPESQPRLLILSSQGQPLLPTSPLPPQPPLLPHHSPDYTSLDFSQQEILFLNNQLTLTQPSILAEQPDNPATRPQEFDLRQLYGGGGNPATANSPAAEFAAADSLATRVARLQSSVAFCPWKGFEEATQEKPQ
jgi:hypothetical protein